jgi:hypothetical protein
MPFLFIPYTQVKAIECLSNISTSVANFGKSDVSDDVDFTREHLIAPDTANSELTLDRTQSTSNLQQQQQASQHTEQQEVLPTEQTLGDNVKLTHSVSSSTLHASRPVSEILPALSEVEVCAQSFSSPNKFLCFPHFSVLILMFLCNQNTLCHINND